MTDHETEAWIAELRALGDKTQEQREEEQLAALRHPQGGIRQCADCPQLIRTREPHVCDPTARERLQRHAIEGGRA